MGAKMAPMEKLRDGRSTCLRWPHLKGRHDNQPIDGVGGGGGTGEAMRMGGTRGGGRLPIASGGEWSDEKKENREGDGASDFGGSVEWLVRRNNQPKVGRIFGVYLGEAARRAKMIWEDVVTPFWPSD
jgi:hypothetical protein